MHFVRDGHINSNALCESLNGEGSLHAFSDLIQACCDVFELSSFAKFLADKTIARKTSSTSQDQIAQPGETHQRLETCAFAQRQPRHLSQPACDQCSNAV